ncbi:MAG: LysM peptidoglycan-binding domain-containing protein [Deltaproteobacteria bacterium]|nr:LysM peptidoglycan-binding domain-containing protein [Deltaproteobacteria bacterium]MBW2153162.1 LysM peptidoglycan-binding domain-containing protein [Deltaproteobacteria bacterium]
MCRKFMFCSLLSFLFYQVTVAGAPAETTPSKKIEHETGIYYTVEKGDTLWSISERFFDTPLKWPDLWKDNPHISNPHQIEPGTRIRLYYEKGLAQIRLVEKKEPESVQEKKPQADAPYLLFSAIEHTGFIKTALIEPSGVIFRTENDIELISAGDLVYIRKDKPKLFVPGAKFTVYRTFNLRRDSRTLQYDGYHYYPTGLLEIIANEPDYAVGKIVKPYRTILRADVLLPYKKRSPKIMIVESKAGVQGQIIGSEEHELAFGNHSVAFIDKGSRDGIAPGQIYSLYLERDVRLEKKERKHMRLSSFDIGTLFVLHTQRSTATVLILTAQRMISSGTKFRTQIREKR